MIWPKKTVFIQASPEQVFAYVSSPFSQRELWPSIVDVSHFELQSNGGFNYRCQYKLVGRLFHLEARLADYRPGRSLSHIYSNHLGDVGQTSWSFDAHPEGTLVSYSCRGFIPPRIKPWLPQGLITRMFQREIDLTLDHLKRYMENSETSLDMGGSKGLIVEREI